MTLSVTSGPDELTDEVTVTLWMDKNSYSIWLTAALGEYTMKAQLTANSAFSLSVPDSNLITWNLALIAKEEAGDDT